MIKKNKSRAGTSGPQTAQLDSIERLLDEERFNEASAKAERLAAEFPEHTRLRALRIQALAATGEIALATLIAHEWTQAQANSQRAWGLLYTLASELGLGFLAYGAHERLEALGASDSVRTEEALGMIASTKAKYSQLDGAEGLHSDLGLLYLITERLDAARAQLEQTAHPVPRTNLAAVLFDQGKMPEAIEIAQSAWDSDPNTTHAARTLVRALLYSGELERARVAGEKLRTVAARAPDELAAQLETLDLLEDFEAAKNCFNAFSRDLYKDYRRDVVARAKHAAAVAFMQTGDRAKAQSLWEEAIADNPQHRLYHINLANAKAKKSTEPAWLELMGDAFPALHAKAIEKSLQEAGGAEVVLQDPSVLETQIHAHSIYLSRMLRLSDPLFRAIVREELAGRADHDDSHAEEALGAFVTYSFGADGERIEALRGLYFAGKIERDSQVKIFLRGEQRELHVEVPMVKPRRALKELPDEAIGDYVRAVFATEHAGLRQGLAKLEQWLGQATLRRDQLVLDHRIILLLHAMRGREREAQERLRAALDAGDALPRTFAFAARKAASEGDADRGARLLEGQLPRSDMDDEDIAPVLLAQQELHASRGEEDQELAAWVTSEMLGAFEAEEV
ncbi:MAG: tetratricopeptide repeat protein [Betaproteobacteria bacterium]|nr:tetratricopeptide repeat protein [Betaproteobacteria bacterium]